MGKSKVEVPPPAVGQQYLDTENRRWSVRGIRPLGSVGGPYYVLDLDFRMQDSTAARLRMSSREFFKLAASGFLKPLQRGT